jgi:hypothetical protein
MLKVRTIFDETRGSRSDQCVPGENRESIELAVREVVKRMLTPKNDRDTSRRRSNGSRACSLSSGATHSAAKSTLRSEASRENVPTRSVVSGVPSTDSMPEISASSWAHKSDMSWSCRQALIGIDDCFLDDDSCILCEGETIGEENACDGRKQHLVEKHLWGACSWAVDYYTWEMMAEHLKYFHDVDESCIISLREVFASPRKKGSEWDDDEVEQNQLVAEPRTVDAPLLMAELYSVITQSGVNVDGIFQQHSVLGKAALRRIAKTTRNSDSGQGRSEAGEIRKEESGGAMSREIWPKALSPYDSEWSEPTWDRRRMIERLADLECIGFASVGQKSSTLTKLAHDAASVEEKYVISEKDALVTEPMDSAQHLEWPSRDISDVRVWVCAKPGTTQKNGPKEGATRQTASCCQLCPEEEAHLFLYHESALKHLQSNHVGEFRDNPGEATRWVRQRKKTICLWWYACHHWSASGWNNITARINFWMLGCFVESKSMRSLLATLPNQLSLGRKVEDFESWEKMNVEIWANSGF